MAHKAIAFETASDQVIEQISTPLSLFYFEFLNGIINVITDSWVEPFLTEKVWSIEGDLVQVLKLPGLSPVHLILAALVILIFSTEGHSQDQAYINSFIYYWKGLDQIPLSVPTLDEYAVPETYDSRHLGAVMQIWLDRINTIQNRYTDMAWGSSYQSQSLNDMYRATHDSRYLEENLEIVRATMANRDDKKGFTTFFGENAPAWGTAYYIGKHTIHAVHTGLIAFGVVEFLELVQNEPELLAQITPEFSTWLAEITETLDWHDRQWVEGPGPDEGHYIFKDDIASEEGNILPGNWQSAMGLALWGSWKASGNTKHKTMARKIGQYMKRRMGLYSGPTYGPGAYFWDYYLSIAPLNNPLPEQQVVNLNGGEDFSHAALTAAFPLTLGLEGEIFTEADMQAFARTIIHGFGRLGEGILLGNVAGTTVFGPNQVLIPGYFLRIAPFSQEAYDVIAEFLLRYQQNPRNVDISQLIRFRPDTNSSDVASWSAYR